MAGHTGGAHLVKFHIELYTADPAQRGPVTGGNLRPPQIPRMDPAGGIPSRRSSGVPAGVRGYPRGGVGSSRDNCIMDDIKTVSQGSDWLTLAVHKIFH